MSVEIAEVGAERAADVLAVIHAAFVDRPVLDPPSTALAETEESVAAALAAHGGLLATAAGRPVGALLFEAHGPLLGLRRVGVVPEVRRHGAAAMLATRAAEVARGRGFEGLELEARAELPTTVRFWERHGYAEVDRDGPQLRMQRLLPVVVRLPEAGDTRAAGRAVGALLRSGDVVILTGDLGAGKTTLTQGLGEGLGVRGPITSPTFVIARVHPSLEAGPELVHVDAYRLGGAAELDDLDLDTDLDVAVTVVEWGEGLAEVLSRDHVDLHLERADDDVRTLTVAPVGERWVGTGLRGALASPA